MSSKESIDQEIASRVNSIFPGRTASAVASLVATPRPQGWKRGSTSTYYKERYALEIREFVDNQIKTGEDIVYKFENWCGKDELTAQTLYTRIYQSIRYLIERLNPEGKYNEWFNKKTIRKVPRFGIVVSVKDIEAETPLRPKMEVPRSDMPAWERELIEWIESDSDKPFCKERLDLTDEDVMRVKKMIKDIESLIPEITDHSIKVIKMV